MVNPTQRFNFDFMGKRRQAFIFSLALIIGSLISLATRGLNFGIDFTGGALVEVSYQEAVELDQVRSRLAAAELGDAVAQYFGSAREVLIRVPQIQGQNNADASDAIIAALREPGLPVEVRRAEYVGPQVGEELQEDGGLAMIYALLMVFIYIAFRFQRLFSVGAIAALAHDVIITVGFFSITQIDFDLTVLAALLAVIGYSLNDTIVVFDRIRENFLKMKSEAVVTINKSINHTLARTLMTSLTTMLVLLALLAFGGEVIHGFTVALMVGVVVGTYSSIYVASASVLAFGVKREHVVPAKKEGADLGGTM